MDSKIKDFLRECYKDVAGRIVSCDREYKESYRKRRPYAERRKIVEEMTILTKAAKRIAADGKKNYPKSIEQVMVDQKNPNVSAMYRFLGEEKFVRAYYQLFGA